MKAKASLVGSDSAVELYAVSGIHLNLSFIIHPRNAELDLPLRLNQPLKQGILPELLLIGLNDYPK